VIKYYYKHSRNQMAPRKGVKRGTIREQTKEILALAFFLQTGNKWVNADRIREAWDPKSPRSIGYISVPDEISPRGRTLSRAGAVKVCERLILEKILHKQVTLGYRNKRVNLYQLREDSREGFLNLARKVQPALKLLIESDYGRRGIHKWVIPDLEKQLGIDIGDWRENVEWVLGRSPTAFTIATVKGLAQGEIAKLEKEDVRLKEFLATLLAAMRVDRASLDRGWLLTKDKDLGIVEGKIRGAIEGEGSASHL
jgi:hypothetical protein